ncbi:MAG: hypothetical protein AAF558_15820, partial [Verrucomicrobiota bacterium]
MSFLTNRLLITSLLGIFTIPITSTVQAQRDRPPIDDLCAKFSRNFAIIAQNIDDADVKEGVEALIG